jgi:hypothetical protein
MLSSSQFDPQPTKLTPLTTSVRRDDRGSCQANALLGHGQGVAAKPKSLARNNKTGCRSSGSASAPSRTAFRGQTDINRQPTMNRDDALFWLSLFWLVAFCGVAIWLLLVR